MATYVHTAHSDGFFVADYFSIDEQLKFLIDVDFWHVSIPEKKSNAPYHWNICFFVR